MAARSGTPNTVGAVVRAAVRGTIPLPPIDKLRSVGEVLADLRKGGPQAVGLAKRLVYEVPGMEQKEAFEYTTRLSGKLFAGEEAKEGMAAFLGRRKPSWAEDDPET